MRRGEGETGKQSVTNPNREDALFALALEKLPKKRSAFLDALA
jgi:hypothetical protein